MRVIGGACRSFCALYTQNVHTYTSVAPKSLQQSRIACPACGNECGNAQSPYEVEERGRGAGKREEGRKREKETGMCTGVTPKRMVASSEIVLRRPNVFLGGGLRTSYACFLIYGLYLARHSLATPVSLTLSALAWRFVRLCR